MVDVDIRSLFNKDFVFQAGHGAYLKCQHLGAETGRLALDRSHSGLQNSLGYVRFALKSVLHIFFGKALDK